MTFLSLLFIKVVEFFFSHFHDTVYHILQSVSNSELLDEEKISL